MDNLTHTLTGLMLSRAGFNRWCPRATPLLLVASNLPDIDILFALGGSLDYLDQHRGYTHSLTAAPLLGAAAATLVRLFDRKALPWMRAAILATAGILCHLLLDWTNTYGIRMLLPFSGEWLRLDITNVVDVWIWTVLALCVAGPLLSRLVSSEIGAKPGTGRGAAIFALAFLIGYNCGRYVAHERAVNLLLSHSYSGAAPRRVGAFPHFANPWAWTTVVETPSAVILQKINLLLTYDPTGGESFFYPPPSRTLEAARSTRTFQRYLNFAQFPLWQVVPLDRPEGGARVDVIDLRFGDPGHPRFVATAVVNAAFRVDEEGFSFGK